VEQEKSLISFYKTAATKAATTLVSIPIEEVTADRVMTEINVALALPVAAQDVSPKFVHLFTTKGLIEYEHQFDRTIVGMKHMLGQLSTCLVAAKVPQLKMLKFKSVLTSIGLTTAAAPTTEIITSVISPIFSHVPTKIIGAIAGPYKPCGVTDEDIATKFDSELTAFIENKLSVVMKEIARKISDTIKPVKKDPVK